MEGPPVSAAGAELSRRRDAADHRARVETERGIQRYRTLALFAGAAQGLIYPADRAIMIWATLGALAVSVVVARRVMAHDRGPTVVRRVGVLTLGFDVVLIALFLSNNLRDPTDPIQMLPLFLAAEGAVRWGRNGGIATGFAAGVMAATWSVVVHARQDIPQPLAFVTFRVVAVLIIGSLLGSTVSAVRRQRRLADMVCNASSDLIVSFDLNGTVRTVNPACEAILGYTQDELIGTDRAELIFDEDKPEGPPDIESLRRLGARHVELEFTHKAGHPVWLELDLQPDLQEGFVYAIGRDVSERRQTEAELRHRVDHDALTGAANRAHLVGRLACELRAPRRIFLLFVDLDGFKAVNDSHGHRAGDCVLVEVVERIRSIVGDNDLVVRLAGDEFCVLLAAPVADDAARDVATSIGDGLAEPFRVGDAEVRLTASVGRAASTPADRPADLLERADQAMYVAKRLRGRPARRSTDGPPPAGRTANASSRASSALDARPRSDPPDPPRTAGGRARSPHGGAPPPA